MAFIKKKLNYIAFSFNSELPAGILPFYNTTKNQLLIFHFKSLINSKLLFRKTARFELKDFLCR